MEKKKRIIILTDFTNTCYQSLTYGLEFCRHYGYQPEILHVETPSCNPFVDSIERQKVSNLAELYNSKFGLGASVVIRNGVLSSVITDEVRQGGFSLIILGTHGKKGFQTVTGSAAARIISSQDIPIIVVQSRKFSPIDKVLLPVPNGADSPFCGMVGELLKEMGVQWKIFHRDDTFDHNLPRQAVTYADDNGFGLILCNLAKSINNDNAGCASIVDQILFNIPQIPVMCV